MFPAFTAFSGERYLQIKLKPKGATPKKLAEAVWPPLNGALGGPDSCRVWAIRIVLPHTVG